MTHEELHARFLEMEGNAAEIAGAFVVNGMQAWPCLRLAMLHNFALHPEGGAYIHRADGFAGGIYKSVRDFSAQTWEMFANAPKNACLLPVWFRPRTWPLKGREYCPCVDPVAEEVEKLGLPAVRIQHGSAAPFPEKAYVGSTLNVPLPVRRDAFVPYSKLQHIRAYKEYFRLCRQYGLPRVSELFVLQTVELVRAYAALYEKALTLMRPRMVCLHWYLEPEKMGLAAACRKLGVPCVEYQHGIQEWPNLAYDFQYIPENGFDCVPEWFFHWGEFSAKLMRSRLAGQKYHKAVIAGLPEYLAWKEGRIVEDPNMLERFNQRIRGKKVVTVAFPLMVPEARFRALEEAIILSPDDWIWLLRQHPRDMYREEKRLVAPESKIERECSSMLNVHTVLSHSRHLVTAWSSCSHEAMSLHHMRVTTISNAGTLYFKDAVERGGMCFADSAQDILNSVAEGFRQYPYVEPKPAYIATDRAVLTAALGQALGGAVENEYSF